MNPQFVQMTPQQQQQQQRGFLLLFLLFFFVLTSGPGELRHNARRNRMENFQEDKRNFELKKSNVKDTIILDLSKSNEILELENRQLKISVLGLMQKLREAASKDESDRGGGRGGGGGENFISQLKEEFNLTSVSGLGSVGPSSSSGSSSTKSRNNNKENEKEVMLELPGRTLDDARMQHKEEEEDEGKEESASLGTRVPRRAFVPSSLR